VIGCRPGEVATERGALPLSLGVIEICQNIPDSSSWPLYRFPRITYKIHYAFTSIIHSILGDACTLGGAWILWVLLSCESSLRRTPWELCHAGSKFGGGLPVPIVSAGCHPENVPGERERRTTQQRRGLVPEHLIIDGSFGCALASSQQGAGVIENKAQNRVHGIHKIIEYVQSQSQRKLCNGELEENTHD